MKKHLITLLLLSFGLLGFSQLKTKKYIRNVTNNSENEIAPFLSLDGKTLIYTRKRAMDDQWKTQLSTFENGKWQRPTFFNLGEKINEDWVYFCPYMSPDNNYFFFSKRYSYPSNSGWGGTTKGEVYWVNSIEIFKHK